jgi:hypothetical protein
MTCAVILGAAKNLTIRRETLRIAQGDRLLTVLALLFLLSACAAQKVPDWVTGARASAYPDDRYMIGVGQGDTRAVAEERAYAALARIFKTEIVSQSKDWESYFSLERKAATQIERKLTVETMTKVSTDKVLENVKIVDTWKDPKVNIFSALAVLERPAATAALSARIAELDDAIDRDVKESYQNIDKLLTLRQLHRAIRNVMTRESLNSDLRIISGHALRARFSVPDLTEELRKFLTRSLVIAVEVQGDHAAAVRQAIIETLVREALPVTTGTSVDASTPDLLIKGTAKLWAADLPDPKFRYVRWCGDFTIISPETQRIVGTVTRSGREGHLNYREASNRALAVLKQEIGRAVVQSFTDQIYGGGSGDFAPPLAACPEPQAP